MKRGRCVTRDLRKYASQTNLRLWVGFILLLFLVGDGLIYIFFGRGAALMGAACLLLGLAPLVLIGLAMWSLDWIVKRANRE